MQVEIFTSPMYKLQNLHAQYPYQICMWTYTNLYTLHMYMYFQSQYFFLYLCLAKPGHITVGQNTDNYASYPSYTQYLIVLKLWMIALSLPFYWKSSVASFSYDRNKGHIFYQYFTGKRQYSMIQRNQPPLLYKQE